VAGGVLADRLGRRRLLIVTAIVFGLGAIGAALAPGTAWLIAARVVAGAAIGIASFVAPLYISEIAPVAIRGKLVSINQVALTSGIVISYLHRLRLCRLPGVALDVCDGGDSRRPHLESD
jgi:SP family galactose:H+ symporter-like MFS transporter